MKQPKNIVGIDLGTTNIVVGYLPLSALEDDAPTKPTLFNILQEFPKESLEERECLPSFLFERINEKFALPWKAASRFIVGEYARERGEEIPARLISSAKSWLCNPRIDRREAILPWNSQTESVKISPLEAVTEFLSHIRHSWNHSRKEKLEDQTVIITIPASFDAIARELTLEAATAAGIPDVMVLEEPQAAFYSWITQTDVPWRDQVKKGDVVLVIDVGGGTTDFSLIEVGETGGDLSLERVAVGNHILLGGDNMDLTLAFHVKQKLEESKKKINTWQTIMLSHQCRKAKERLLSDPTKKSEPIVIAGRGSSVIGGAIKSSLDRKEVESLLIDGFFPFCRMDEEPSESQESGFREVNLAYASDPAITRHLARFLSAQSGKNSYRFPQAVLFNGGVFRSSPLRDRLIEVINTWMKEANKPEVRILDGFDLSRAVALGATAFGSAKQGKGIRIRGGVSQSYYIGIESSLPAVPGLRPPLKALCVASMGMEEGTQAQVLNKSFDLTLGRQVRFSLFKSTCRRDDKIGDMLDEIPAELEETSGVSTKLEAHDEIPPGTPVSVNLHVEITEVGTLDIFCCEKNTDRRWKLEFNVRDAIK